MKGRTPRSLAALALFCAASGCAALSKSSPLDVRFYTPELDQGAPRDARPAVPPPAKAPALRLGRVAGGAELGEEIAYRDSPVEVGFYDGSRWTERPEVYVGRALDRALFGSGRGLRHVLAGAAPVLDVRVLAFEEVRAQGKGERQARVTLLALLHDDRAVLLEEPFTQNVAVSGSGVEPLVLALAQAMQATVDQVATRVVATLGQAEAPGASR